MSCIFFFLLQHSFSPIVTSENPVAEPAEFAIDHLKKMVARYNLPAIISRIILPFFYKLVVTIFLYRIGAIWNYKAPVELVAQLSPRVQKKKNFFFSFPFI